MSWRDEPVKKGELVDALEEAADRIERGTKALEASMRSWRSGRFFVEVMHLCLHAQIEALREIAAKFKED